jgi:hypothetical protein
LSGNFAGVLAHLFASVALGSFRSYHRQVRQAHAHTGRQGQKDTHRMDITGSIVAVFPNHIAAEAAVKKLTNAGFNMKHLSVIGKGYHTEEHVTGFYNTGDRVRFWGTRGAFWGGLWGLFFGGLFLTIPVVGNVVILGYLAAAVFSAVEGAVLTGGLGAIGAALYSVGVPKDSLLQYETAIKADGFLVVAHGSADEVMHAKDILGLAEPSSLDQHDALTPLPPAA